MKENKKNNSPDEIHVHKTLASKYENMKQDREPYLNKAKEAAKYTLPSLLKDDDSNVMSYETPNQSVGADGINNLSAKVTLTMLPPNQPFFKFDIDEMSMKTQAQQSGLDATEYSQQVIRGLSLTEKMLVDYNEHNGDRICLGEAQKHLYIAGNVFLVHQPNQGLKYYPLTRFVVKRDYCGNVLKAITKETVGFYALPKDLQDKVLEALKAKEKTDDVKGLDHKELTLYTGYKRTDKFWVTHQEIEGIEIEESEGKYPIDICPFMALRYTRIDGESYGRGLIEEYIGDLSYLDALTKAIKESCLAASKLVMLVNPSGTTSIRALNKAKNGDFVSGNANDVTPLQANKYYDLRTAQEAKTDIEKRLDRVFLLAQAVQRDAERVTAQEIQYMIRDLEEALGNHYSIMCKEFQLAYIKISFFHMRKEKKNKLPDLIRDNNVKLTVTTGLEALGRGSDLNKLMNFGQTLAQFAQIAQVTNMKMDVIASKIAASLNLDIEGLMPTQEELQQQQQAQQQSELINKVAPNAVNKYGDMLKAQQEQQTQQEQTNERE